MTVSDDPSIYVMRGHRVPPMSSADISYIAERVAKIFKVNRYQLTSARIEKFIVDLEENGIYIDPIFDHEWIDIARAMVDPQSGTICMPNALYEQLIRGESAAVKIFLHELGHIFLCHKALLHFSDTNGNQLEDAEWQADEFADALMGMLRIKEVSKQLEINYF
ncbi:hypothetical protein KDX38_23290 [Pseudomonas sp. CDFA 602]|uniref:ImmA/IrrE family metallo-endopeptidase n=1 Tax=Pseudomonas californiensis TaxID=2829823 RepID=UPI001E495445|nr:hypothetical protein [Pseudomonas californiensis]MCD5996518.1 hypothetical protein [Pseudomonas californiensis]MCD6002117.1 hypothetical protein [Pseudomonas californiensis]